MTNADIANMSKDELLALVAKMQAQPAKRISFKVSEKGAVSAYGLGRFPVTLYSTQWERLLNEADALRAFLTANASLLAVKA